MKRIQVILTLILVPSIPFLFSSCGSSPKCDLSNKKIKVIVFYPHNEDANTARRSVINRLKSSDIKVVNSGPYDLALEGTVEYSQEYFPDREKKVSRVRLYAIGNGNSYNASSSGGLSGSSSPSLLGNHAAEIMINKICQEETHNN